LRCRPVPLGPAGRTATTALPALSPPHFTRIRLTPRRSPIFAQLLLFSLLPFGFLGCAADEAQIERALRTDHYPAAHAHDLDAHYRLHCPDTIDVQIMGRPTISGTRTIEPDGRVRLGEDLNVLVSGKSVPEATESIAGESGVSVPAVRVRVVKYNSQSIYVFGTPAKAQQVVAYCGPETVLDLLQRVGLADTGATLGDIRIVRAHVADGKPPEVFHIDLRAVLLQHDLQSNIRVEPFDRIYIEEGPGSRLACCVPPVLQPLYRAVFGVK
jgi:protein involved in polysaccharide export with SLBB domain